MRSRPAWSTTWVRACVLIATALVVVVGLFVLSGVLVEGAHPTLGDVAGDADLAVLLAAFLLGPAWVLKAFRRPPPPRDDGPPRGGIVPLPTRAPSRSDAVDRAA